MVTLRPLVLAFSLLLAPSLFAVTDLAIGVDTFQTTAAQGDEIVYNIVIVNNGPDDATGVILTDVLPSELLFQYVRTPMGWDCTTPEAGTNGTVRCSGAVPASNGTSASFLLVAKVRFDAAGPIVNTATVTHSAADPNPENSTASATTTISGVSADLSITKTADTARAAAGAAFTWTITVTNHGPDRASNVTLTDVLPPQLQFLWRMETSTTPTDFFCNVPPVNTNGTVTCTASSMAAGTTSTFTIGVAVAPGATGSVTNTATVSSPTSDPDDADRTATALPVELVPGADLQLAIFTPLSTAPSGFFFNYSLAVQNKGPSDASNVVVTADLPPNLLFERLSPAAIFTCTTPPVGKSGTITCTTPTLRNSVVAGIGLRVRVAPEAINGTATIRGEVTSSTFDLDSGDTTAESAPITLERRIDPVTGATRLPQTAPQIATTYRNALAVWREGSGSIRGALFQPSVAGSTTLDFAAPQLETEADDPVVAAADDRYLVVWRETKAAQGRVLARRVRTDGSFLDAQPLVLDNGPAVRCCSDPGDPRPAVASNGRDFYVAWVTANHDVRGLAVPAEGAVTAEPSIVSRDSDGKIRSHFDLELVATPAMYLVAWLDRLVQPALQPRILRYARVTAEGALLDPQSSRTISGPPLASMTATAASSGAVLTVEYEQPTAFPGITKQCLAFQVLTSNGDPDGVLRPRGCNDDSAYQGGLHSELLPVARGYLLVQPGRLDTSGEGDEPVRVYGVDPNLLALDGLVTPGIVARELAAAPWYGGALFVYTHSDESGVPRVFAYLVQERSRRTRAVRH